MRRTTLALLALASLVWLVPGAASAAPVALPIPPVEGLAVDPPPPVSAPSWILYDATFDLVLASHDPDAERSMASTTKMMTALVAYRHGDVDDMVTVSQAAADVGEAEIGLVAGEQIPLSTLITTMLVRSANDAAMAIAEHIGGTVEGFAALMNAEAEHLGLEHSSFANPHGLDEPGHHSSAADLLAIARAGMEIPEFRRAAGVRVQLFPDAPDGTQRVAHSTNHLLWDYEGAMGVKTGFTGQAGMVLAAVAERDERQIYAVVMGSELPTGHFEDATALLDYGFESFGVVPLIISGESYGTRLTGDERSPVVAAATAEAFVHLAAAGVLDPRIELVEGEPALVADDDLIEVPLEPANVEPLPDSRTALSWLWELVDGEAA